MKEISASALSKALTALQPPLLIDVREPEELSYGALPNSEHFPLQDLAGRIEALRELVADADGRMIVVYCRVGGRSELVIQHLEKLGFPEMYNLVGGTNAFADVDNCVSRY